MLFLYLGGCSLRGLREVVVGKCGIEKLISLRFLRFFFKEGFVIRF